MPLRPLPPVLIERLKTLVAKEISSAERRGNASRVHGFHGSLKNIDPRRRQRADLPLDSTEGYGRRVRQLAVRRRFPEIGRVVIKRVHGESARLTIQEIINRVRIHNKRCRPQLYVLLEPVAYDIGANLVAMAKVNRPTIKDVVESTVVGKKFAILQKKVGLGINDLKAAGLEMLHNTGFYPRNVLVVGAKDGKFEFLPLIDLW
ncbi:MAG: hypothetical protein AABW85_01480 [archaeon]